MAEIYPSLKEINRAAPLWVIDRIEEGWAVLENSDTHEIISLPLNSLPEKAKQGTTLVRVNGSWFINEVDTALRAARIKEKFAKLRNK